MTGHPTARTALSRAPAAVVAALLAVSGCSSGSGPGEVASARVELAFAPAYREGRVGPAAAPALPDSARVTIEVFLPEDGETPSRREVHLLPPDAPSLRTTLEDLPAGVGIDLEVLVETSASPPQLGIGTGSQGGFLPVFEGSATGVVLEAGGTNRVRVPLIPVGRALLLGIDDRNVRWGAPRSEVSRVIVPVFLSHSLALDRLSFVLVFDDSLMWPDSVAFNPTLAANPDLFFSWFVGRPKEGSGPGAGRFLVPMSLSIQREVGKDQIVPFLDGPLFEIYFRRQSFGPPAPTSLIFSSVSGLDSGSLAFTPYLLEPTFTFPP